MSCFKGIEELTAEIASLQRLIPTLPPCDVMELKTSLDSLSITITDAYKRCKHIRGDALRIELYGSIGSSSAPVELGSQLEGFKIAGLWTYRNSNTHKNGFCRRWRMAGTEYETDNLDGLYLESLAIKEAK